MHSTKYVHYRTQRLGNIRKILQEKRKKMSNIQIVQAAFIQRKVQKEYEQTGRDWLEIIAEEVEKIRNERG